MQELVEEEHECAVERSQDSCVGKPCDGMPGLCRHLFLALISSDLQPIDLNISHTDRTSSLVFKACIYLAPFSPSQILSEKNSNLSFLLHYFRPPGDI